MSEAMSVTESQTMPQMMSEIISENVTNLTTQNLLERLSKRVSKNAAKLLLDSATAKSGIQTSADNPLNKEELKALCLQLINQGGPSFQVGQSTYKEYLM